MELAKYMMYNMELDITDTIRGTSRKKLYQERGLKSFWNIFLLLRKAF